MDSDDSEYEALDSTLSGSLMTTVNVSGGRGGPGGRAGQHGGTGGTGQGPRLNFKSKTTVVKVRVGRVNDSGEPDSQDDFNFRRIPLGDLFLQRQLYVDGPKADQVHFGRKRCSVRIVRSAKIGSCEFTVATYQGDNAEREWKEEVDRCMDIRHESILQLYGTVRCRNTWVAVFHGADLIRFDDFSLDYCHSPILECYVYVYAHHDRNEVDFYLDSNFGCNMPDRVGLLINRSNGRLCIDLESDRDFDLSWTISLFSENLAEPLSPVEILSPSNLSYIVKTLTLDQCHKFIYAWKSSLPINIPISSTDTAHFGGIYCTAGDNSSLQVVALPQLRSDREITGVLTRVFWGHNYVDYDSDCGFTRISYSEVTQGDQFCVQYFFIDRSTRSAWMSQANHIFALLDVESDLDRYVFVARIRVTVELRRPRKHSNPSPEGYLFMCPSQDFLTGPATFKCPKCPWYWSLDPSGAEKLDEKKATELGFPTIHSSIEIEVKSWDEFAYEGLCDFHERKGFNPYSRDMAVELNEPFYELFSDEEPLIVEESVSAKERANATEPGREGGNTGEEGHDMMDFLDGRKSMH
ncbi:hypothetical protein R3P38DRAFT_67678 [Favolaschia claudopus]|uniref:Uncharacterized protein n=1 Tax=Favolaschia claudopus TaxID=2862362 RepID=A0AAW0D0Z0_9AGAR